jgi:hypothetical protein
MASLLPNVRDALGQRGEIIFSTLISKFHSEQGPIFRPQFLGDKWPTVDFLVELLGVRGSRPYFFVQVRATRQGYRVGDKRLRIQVTERSVREIASYPAPTYIVGIDEIKERGYIVSANGENLRSLTSLSTRFPINKRNREALWKEVRSFWSENSTAVDNSRFADRDWR